MVYVLPGKMGGVATSISNLQAHCERERFAQYTILTHANLDRDSRFDGPMAGEGQASFVHTLPLENLHSVLRRFGKIMPAGGGVLVASDWLELAWVCARGTERAVFQIVHGDLDYYYHLALRHQEIVDVFIACSRRIHDTLANLLPGRTDSVHYIPHGVPIPRAGRCRRSGPLKLLYAGRLEQGLKRVFDLARIDEALERRNVEVEWTIAGGGPDEGALRDRWERGGVVRWAGVLSNRDTVDLMREQDVFILPSASEGLPIALLEAMSVGLVPVVSELPSGVPELVISGETGIRIPVGDIEGFAGAVAKLDCDRTHLETLSAAARRLVSERFDARLQANRYMDLYRRWRELRRPRTGKKRLAYGSRLDSPWIPNSIVRFIRTRRQSRERR